MLRHAFAIAALCAISLSAAAESGDRAGWLSRDHDRTKTKEYVAGVADDSLARRQEQLQGLVDAGAPAADIARAQRLLDTAAARAAKAHADCGC